MWCNNEEPRLPVWHERRKLKGEARERELMRLMAELKADYEKLNKLWGIVLIREV